MNSSQLIHSLRKNSLIIFTTLGLVVSLSLIVYYADQTFIDAKKGYIINNRERYFSDISRLNLLIPTEAGNLFSGDSAQSLNILVQQFKSITDNPQSIIYRIELREKNKGALLDIRNDSKLISMNNRNNCLYSRHFSQFITISFDITPDSKIELVNYYTSPLNEPILSKMAASYRWKVNPLMAILFLIYLGSLRWFILPVRRVIDKLEGIKEKEFSPIRNSRTLLETAYNKMSRNANILDVNLRMNDLTAGHPDLVGDSLLTILLPLAKEIYPGICLFKTRSVPGENKLEAFFSQENPSLIEIKEASLINRLRKSDDRNPFEAQFENHKGFIVFIENLGNESWYLYLEKTVEGLEDAKGSLKSLSQQMSLAVRSRELQRRFIEQEKSQVSIHLARSLGHDVTNILASIRWDLDTLDTLLKGQVFSTDEKNRGVFAESMESLGHGTELLQEIIEIYRSFMYLERPCFEKVDMKPVLERLMELFQRSTTHHIDLRLVMAHPVCTVMDPRLFKLAFFNLLTNALEAIKKQGIQDPSLRGLIEVSVDSGPDNKTILRMSDNGTGIRNPEGSLMDESEIHRIFQYGFTTKIKSGGLGLAWVYTIICEVHKGILAAHNQPDGGSEFIITLPLLTAEVDKTSISSEKK